jgi:2-phospho-L-lactate transferase/gluconeogenesis factor (CofD/UPF0052 family)
LFPRRLTLCIGHLRHLTTRVTHILPVSDDGGSTAEIVRVLGGPAVGDIRSRCLRLADDADAEVTLQLHWSRREDLLDLHIMRSFQAPPGHSDK